MHCVNWFAGVRARDYLGYFYRRVRDEKTHDLTGAVATSSNYRHTEWLIHNVSILLTVEEQRVLLIEAGAEVEALKEGYV